jgi:peroxiredoxin
LGGLAIGIGIGIAISLGFVNSSNKGTPKIALGFSAPEFKLITYLGDEVKLSDLKGSPVLVNFWATWCQPCRLEMPNLQGRFEQYHPDIYVLAVNFDEPADLVQSFAEELNLTFPILLDPGGRIQSLYQIRGYPTTFLIDSDGIIRVIHIGFMTENQLDDYLKQVGVGG